jgi:phosphoribosylformylglycinamidine (FGAM) synthase PurS component
MASAHSIAVYSYLLNADLACMTANETIVRMLGFSKLLHLRRFDYWDIEIEAESEALAQKDIKHILSASYYLLNPNKSGYSLNAIEKPGLKLNESVFLVNVASKEPFNRTDLIKKINQKVGVNIASLRKSVVWELIVDTNEMSQEALEKELLEEVVVSSSRKKGILLNPINEEARILDGSRVYA